MRRTLRMLGFAATGLLLVAGLLVGGVYGFSARDLNASYAIDLEPLVVSGGVGEAELAVRGEHIARIRGCLDCHGEDGGGAEMADDAALGLLWASNLTRGEGGIAGRYTDEDWDRSIRHGVGPDSKPLVFMPAHEFWPMSDDDIAALMAFFRTTAPVDRTAPAPKPGPLARALYLAGDLTLVPAKVVDHDARRPVAPPEGPTPEYGAYLSTGCTGCHGATLAGGRIPGGDPSWPAAANITPDPASGIGDWTVADFSAAVRDGIRPDGSELRAPMPRLRHMTDLEIEAIYRYLMTVEPRQAGTG